jgi:hypothetical protein
MLLIFKMNDCLRHVDYALQSPSNSSLAVAGKYAAKAVLEEDLKNIDTPRNPTGRKNAKNNFESSEKSGRLVHRFYIWTEYFHLLFRIQLFELFSWWNDNNVRAR